MTHPQVSQVVLMVKHLSIIVLIKNAQIDACFF